MDATLELEDDMDHGNSTDVAPNLDRSASETIPLKSRIVHKFYEPIILFTVLNQTTLENAAIAAPEPLINLEDAKQIFQAFVYKLGHVCDSAKGGTTVTSFMVLCDRDIEDRTHYWFASNQRTEPDLEATATFVKQLLTKVHKAPKSPLQQQIAHTDLLYHVLPLHRPRISYYFGDLHSQAYRLVARKLESLLDRVGDENLPKDSEAEFVRKCEKILCMLYELQQSPAGEVITRRAREGRMAGHRSVECWSELRLSTARLLAYLQSIQFFLLAKKKWPELFETFDVSFVRSSQPIPKPIRNSSLTADGIVGRLTRKEKEIQVFRNFVKNLQVFDLDKRIKAEYQKDTFQPIVHAEILLLNWLENNGGIRSERFFNEWMYIGSSKPTCKLCQYYFQEHHSGVEHRPSHGNLYPSWRVPDLLVSQGQEGENARQIMVDRILLRVRKDAFAIVR